MKVWAATQESFVGWTDLPLTWHRNLAPALECEEPAEFAIAYRGFPLDLDYVDSCQYLLFTESCICLTMKHLHSYMEGLSKLVHLSSYSGFYNTVQRKKVTSGKVGICVLADAPGREGLRILPHT